MKCKPFFSFLIFILPPIILSYAVCHIVFLFITKNATLIAENVEKTFIKNIYFSFSYEKNNNNNKIIFGKWNGLLSGCDCSNNEFKDKIYLTECFEEEIKNDCFNVNKSEQKNIEKINEKNIFSNTKKISYLKYLKNIDKKGEKCLKGFKKCGKLDNFNYLCFDNNFECPINDIKINKNKSLINYNSIKLNNNYYFHYSNKFIENKIITNIFISNFKNNDFNIIFDNYKLSPNYKDNYFNLSEFLFYENNIENIFIFNKSDIYFFNNISQFFSNNNKKIFDFNNEKIYLNIEKGFKYGFKYSNKFFILNNFFIKYSSFYLIIILIIKLIFKLFFIGFWFFDLEIIPSYFRKKLIYAVSFLILIIFLQFHYYLFWKSLDFYINYPNKKNKNENEFTHRDLHFVINVILFPDFIFTFILLISCLISILNVIFEDKIHNQIKGFKQLKEENNIFTENYIINQKK